MQLSKISDFLWEIPKHDQMLVSGKIYASEPLLKSIKEDRSLLQVKNVATLPGIVCSSIAMPDIHEGYGFPIGGVAAVDIEDGYISPGGVGYDINCGVRLLRTNLFYNDIKNELSSLMANLYNNIPSGLGSKHAIKNITAKEFSKVLKGGAQWAVEYGYGSNIDLEYTENNGCIENDSEKFLSQRAIERGREQLGTLGSGNHFLEIQVVDEIFDFDIAAAFNITYGQVMVMIHTGSRGFGYQVCDDFLKIMRKDISKYRYTPIDRELIALPFKSETAQRYFNCMNAAANYAWANRQIIKSLTEDNLMKTFALTPRELGFYQIFDISHNIAKIETHNGQKVLVHRKGATKALGPYSDSIPDKYSKIGQPIILPGDMGRASYLLVGTGKESGTFLSCSHGAGRNFSRKKALSTLNSQEILGKLKDKGIHILAASSKTLAEELPEAYKNIDDVVDVICFHNIAKKVAKLRPIGVIKG